jgi:hypothetical protein
MKKKKFEEYYCMYFKYYNMETIAILTFKVALPLFTYRIYFKEYNILSRRQKSGDTKEWFLERTGKWIVLKEN